MKKQLSLFVWGAAMFGMSAVFALPAALAETNTGSSGATVINYSEGPDGSSTVKTTEYKKYETRSSVKSYADTLPKDIYYRAPTAKRSAVYRDYSGCGNDGCGVQTPVVVEQQVEVVQSKPVVKKVETVKKSEGRKYYLAHPFFQPKQGHVGSVTDISYIMHSYDISIANSLLVNPAGDPVTAAKWGMDGFAIKEDLSVGITDNLAIIGALQYINVDYKLDWKDPTVADDKDSDSKIDMWGLGLMWKFIDNQDWIAHAAAYYQWRDISNMFIVEGRAGYKIDNSTIYGLLRGYYVNFDNDSYGNGIENGNQTIFFALNTDSKSAGYFEGGLGLFSAIAEDWTLNIEAIMGSYDWHSQASIKGAIGWQPLNQFALNLYAKTAIYDSANDKDGKGVWYWDSTTNYVPTNVGTFGISKFKETQIGIQAMLYF